MDIFKKITEIDKEIVSAVIENGSIAVDATCGNGNDTLHLAREVGEEGKVFSFDVQKEAILKTERLLKEYDLKHRVVLLNEDHSKLEVSVPPRISAVMFNLGYLPGSDKKVVTKPQNTLKALELSLKLLKNGGIITCVIYQGHEMGKLEASELEKFCLELDPNYYKVIKTISINNIKYPPYLIAIKKRREDD